LPFGEGLFYGDQGGPEAAGGGGEFLDALADSVGADGVTVGIIAYIALRGLFDTDKVSPQLHTAAPVVKEDIHIPGAFVVLFRVQYKLCIKAPVFKIDIGPPELSAEVAVNEGQLPLIVIDEPLGRFRLSKQL